ncbi:DinB family protein [Paenibacillus paridis]|uniref:DinB family protein n=1 Tax=Paenibacillus paridis TaxID=2583376 RepID=UPI00112002A2|nr:DinB family protein [Paenibacillus paridis]
MNYVFNKEWLILKFEEIRKRILKAVNQLNEVQLNWRPDEVSHSIAVLIFHINGNIQERIIKGILRQNSDHNRADELVSAFIPKTLIEQTVQDGFQFVIDTIRSLSDEKLMQTQQVRSRERTNLDMLHQCAAHYSEHMGQIFYIAKQILKENYRSTSI